MDSPEAQVATESLRAVYRQLPTTISAVLGAAFLVFLLTDIHPDNIGESGALEDAFGIYKGRGTASFIDGMLTHTGKGRICNLSLDHDDNSDDDSRD